MGLVALTLLSTAAIVVLASFKRRPRCKAQLTVGRFHQPQRCTLRYGHIGQHCSRRLDTWVS